MKTPRAPSHLTREAQKWWRRINEGWTLDDPGLLILESALEAFDRMKQAQAVLKQDGIITQDRFGQDRQHPATKVERSARDSMIRSLKALNLDIEPLHDRPGRPGGE